MASDNSISNKYVKSFVSFHQQQKIIEVRSQKSQLKKIEDLGAKMEERLILDNRYEK